MRLKQDNNQGKEPRFSGLKWLLVAVTIAAGVTANMHYQHFDVAYRAVIGILVAAVLLWLVYTTAQGHRAWAYIKSARREMTKVVWPNRQETIQTGLVVVVVVAITALLLWGIDTLFLLFVHAVIGIRGS